MYSIAQHALQNLPSYAVPVFVRIMKDNTGYVTGTNKQQKHVLRNQGIDVDLVDSSRGGSGRSEMYWLTDGAYVPFREMDRKALREGKIRL